MIKILIFSCVGIHNINSSNYLNCLVIEEPTYDNSDDMNYFLYRCENYSI